MSLRPAAALSRVTHPLLLVSEFHAFFTSYFWVWPWLLWLIPGFWSSPAQEFSSAPHCSTCLLVSKSKAKSGRILVFQSFGSLYVFHFLLCEKEQRLSLENLRRRSSKICTWDPVSPGPSPYKETKARQTHLPTESRQPVLAISISNQDCLEISWAAVCGQFEEFLTPLSQMVCILIKTDCKYYLIDVISIIANIKAKWLQW